MRIFLVLLLSVVALWTVYGLQCYDCKQATPEHCNRAKKISKKECEIDHEDAPNPVCLTATRIVSNKTVTTRMCGLQGHTNDTCEFLEKRNEADANKGTHFKCIVCDKDLCNGAPTSDNAGSHLEYQMSILILAYVINRV